MSRQPREALPVRRLPSASVHDVQRAVTAEPEVSEVAAPTPAQIRIELERAFADELAEVREAASARGYEEGRNAASCELERALDAAEERARAADAKRQAEHASLVEKLDATIEHIHEVMGRIETEHLAAIADLEPLALEIAFAGLTRLLGRAEHYRRVLSEIVGEAASDVARHGDGLRIRLHPDDADVIRESGQGRAWLERIASDPSLAPGSCIVEAGPRCLDASLMRQLDELQRCLLSACESRHHA